MPFQIFNPPYNIFLLNFCNLYSNIFFICSATGHPNPIITWAKMPKTSREKARIRVTNDRGREIHKKTIQGEVLEINRVNRKDMGTYR